LNRFFSTRGSGFFVSIPRNTSSDPINHQPKRPASDLPLQACIVDKETLLAVRGDGVLSNDAWLRKLPFLFAESVWNKTRSSNTNDFCCSPFFVEMLRRAIVDLRFVAEHFVLISADLSVVDCLWTR
jgi:hypothetical protein